MKKLIVMLLGLMPLLGWAAKDDSKYLAGAVPEENGQVVFSKSFRVPGKTDAEIAQTLNAWAKKLTEQSIEAPGKYARVMDANDSGSTVRVCEWVVFKKKALYLDRTRMRYQLSLSVKDGRATLRAEQIRYYYGENNEGENGQDIKAEEWITDKEALNKKGTKLYPKSGKFRRKTVDYFESLFGTAMDCFEVKSVPAAVVVPQRKGVIED